MKGIPETKTKTTNKNTTMAQYTVQHACGHEHTYNLFGKMSERERKIEWLSEQECPACRRKAEKAALEEQNAALNLPALAGSEKQVAWATDIRAAVVQAVRELFEARRIPEAEGWKKSVMRDAIAAETSAKFWIEKRFVPPLEMARRLGENEISRILGGDADRDRGFRAILDFSADWPALKAAKNSTTTTTTTATTPEPEDAPAPADAVKNDCRRPHLTAPELHAYCRREMVAIAIMAVEDFPDVRPATVFEHQGGCAHLLVTRNADGTYNLHPDGDEEPTRAAILSWCAKQWAYPEFHNARKYFGHLTLSWRKAFKKDSTATLEELGYSEEDWGQLADFLGLQEVISQQLAEIDPLPAELEAIVTGI